MGRSTWILVFIILTSCLRSSYQQQEVDLPETWRVDIEESSDICNVIWWTQFEDPILNELIYLALKNNQDLQEAIARVGEFYAHLKIVNSALFPTVTGNINANRNHGSIVAPNVPPFGFRRIFNDYQAFFNLNWELDVWGRIQSATDAAFADLLSEVEVRRGVVITIVTNLAESYFTLRGLDLQLDISRNTLRSRLDSLNLARDRFHHGETSEMEVKQAQSEVEIAAIRVIELERDIPKQENLISILMGQNPRSIERGLPLNDFYYPVNIPLGLPSDLLLRRPDIIQAEDKMIAANARVAEARALFFPAISLTGLYGNDSEKLHHFLTHPAEVWQVGFSAVQTLFDAGKIYNQVKEAKAIRDETLAHYRQTILKAFREVNDALIDFKKDKELVNEHQRQVRILQDYFHLANLRYAEGEIDYLNVLDAERSLFNAQLQMVQAQIDSLVAVVQLYGALGGGWVIQADDIAVGVR